MMGRSYGNNSTGDDMQKVLILAVAAMFGAAPWVAQAQTPPPTLAQRFAMANITHDGCLTLQQAAAGRLGGVVQQFAYIDTAHKGCVTLDQIKLFRLQQKVQREQQE
jgi:hypothetical protein